MKSIYGEIPNHVIADNKTDLINQIFKMLPYKEDGIENLDCHFSSVLFRVIGLCKLFPNIPELLTVASLLEAARTESNFRLYRKAILDSCSIIRGLDDRLGDADV